MLLDREGKSVRRRESVKPVMPTETSASHVQTAGPQQPTVSLGRAMVEDWAVEAVWLPSHTSQFQIIEGVT